MTHLGLIVLISICFELLIIIKLKEKFKKNIKIYRDFFKVIKSEELNDEKKQEAIFYLSKKLFYSSFLILLSIIFVFFPIFIIRFISDDLYFFLFSLIGMIESIIILFIYLKLRKFICARL